MPTPARVVLAWGLVLLLMTLTNARLAEVVSPELQRAEVLAGLAAVGLMLVAALWTRADPSQAPRRDLQGDQGLVMHSDVTGIVREELGWGSHMLLTAPLQQHSSCSGMQRFFCAGLLSDAVSTRSHL